MELVVDTNVIISALLKKGITRKLLFFDPFEFYTVPFAKSEILNHMSELIRKSKIDEEAFQYLMDTLFAEIQMVEPDIIEPYREIAIEIMKSIDVCDAPFIALAMHLNCSIWSNDKHLKQQNHIKVYSTGEIMEHIQVIK